MHCRFQRYCRHAHEIEAFSERCPEIPRFYACVGRNRVSRNRTSPFLTPVYLGHSELPSFSRYGTDFKPVHIVACHLPIAHAQNETQLNFNKYHTNPTWNLERLFFLPPFPFPSSLCVFVIFLSLSIHAKIIDFSLIDNTL